VILGIQFVGVREMSMTDRTVPLQHPGTP